MDIQISVFDYQWGPKLWPTFKNMLQHMFQQLGGGGMYGRLVQAAIVSSNVLCSFGANKTTNDTNERPQTAVYLCDWLELTRFELCPGA